jgi:hypothetical protein
MKADVPLLFRIFWLLSKIESTISIFFPEALILNYHSTYVQFS